MKKFQTLVVAAGAALTISGSAFAGGLSLSASVTDATVDGTMQTAVISVNGGGAGNFLLALAGNTGNLMEVSTGDGSNLYNHDTIDIGVELFNGDSPFAAADFSGVGFPLSQFDSGWLEFAGTDDTTVSPGFTGEIGSFAFSNGAPDSSEAAAVFDLDQGTPVDTAGPVDVVRLTWSRDTSMTFSALAQIGTPLAGTIEEHLTIVIPAVPAPGALALLGLAGLAGARRRRR